MADRMPTLDELEAAVELLAKIAEFVREKKVVRAGDIYAAFALDLSGLESALRLLEDGGKIRVDGFLVTWIGGEE